MAYVKSDHPAVLYTAAKSNTLAELSAEWKNIHAKNFYSQKQTEDYRRAAALMKAITGLPDSTLALNEGKATVTIEGKEIASAKFDGLNWTGHLAHWNPIPEWAGKRLVAYARRGSYASPVAKPEEPKPEDFSFGFAI